VIVAEARGSGPDRADVGDRILDAARRLVVQTGARRLSLTEVATLAGVSRPSVYRYYQSKEELLDALGKQEYRRFNSTMRDATSGLSGVERLDAAIDVVASFLQEQPPRRLVDLEPGFVNEQMVQVLPMVTEALMTVLTRCAEEGFHHEAAPADLAAAVARTALSHYMFPDVDAGAVLRQIRAAAGLPGS
jgi:AcrR family transcriptional regulator